VRRSRIAAALVVVAAATAAAAPVLRPGMRLDATLVDCGGAVDCWLARRFVPAAWLQPHRQLVVHDATSADAWTALPIATGRLNGDAMSREAVTLGTPELVGTTATVPIAIAIDRLAPDQYTGVLQVAANGQAAIEVPLDLRVRGGPLAALLWLLAGVVLGLWFKFWRERGQAIASSLSELDRWTAIVTTESDANRRVLEPLVLDARDAKHRRRFDQLDAALADIEARRQKLQALDRLARVLTDKQRELEHVRTLLFLRKDTAAATELAKLEALAQRGGGGGSSFDVHERGAADRPRAAAGAPRRSKPAELWYWLVQHVLGRVLRLVVIGAAVLLGLKTLYLDGGTTYGASPFFDGLALFVWGLGAEVSTRVFAQLATALAPKPAPAAASKGDRPKPDAKAGDPRTVALPDDILIRPEPDGPGPFPATDWPSEALALAELDAKGLDGNGVRIAVVDTGVEPDHAKLDWTRLKSIDLDGSDGGDDLHANGHGTTMVSLLASDRGVCSKAEVLSIRTLDSKGSARPSDLAAAIALAVDRRCDVISISAGQADQDDELSEAVAKARAAGALVVAAIRNENPSASAYPARDDGVTSVTPSRPNRTLFYKPWQGWVSIAAPGVDIPVYDRKGAAVIRGSSAATAIVAGVCARLLSTHADPVKRRELAGRLDELLHTKAADIQGGRLIDALATATAIQGGNA
jgi:hypothetical protein